MVPLFMPNTGMKPKFWSFSQMPKTAVAVVEKPRKMLFMA